MDRIGNDGIITFVANRSFLDAKGFDGFRKNLQEEFQYAFIVDLGGNIRENYGKKGVSIGNVFNIQTGVCITFLVRRKKQIHKAVQEKHSCKIHYYCIEDKLDRESKLFWLSTSLLENLDFETIKPDKNYNWLNIADNDWDKLLPLCDKKNKLDSDNKTVFHLYSNGLVSNRDEWVYDYSKENLIHKMEFFYKEYNHEVKRWIQYKKKNKYVDKPSDSNPIVDQFTAERNIIKWSGRLKRDKLRKEKIEKFDKQDIIECLYRPYIKKFLCDSYLSIDVRGSLVYFFHIPNQQKVYRNKIILFPGSSSVKSFQSIATHYLPCLDLLEKTQGCAFYIYDSDSLKDNITDWALEQFHKKYENKKDSKSEKPITKEDVFHYVYAVLHNPTYRKKYELNLKRDFPRIPFYKDFWKWTDWGKELMELHIGYETVEPYSLFVTVDQASHLKQNDDDLDLETVKRASSSQMETTYLRADKENDKILIDSTTTIVGIPPEAWKYQLGNRSALEWILDQYKESKPSDKTIAENFDTYRFADYKEQVIDLIKRVCTVSIETIRIQKEMEGL